MFVFSKMINLSDGKIIIKILLIILLFALSFLTFNYIEKPFRNKKYNFKIIFNLITISFITLLFINFTFIFNNGFKNRFPEILIKNQTINPWELLVEDHGDICFGKIIQCRFGSNSDKKIYLIGDSHMASLSYSLKEKLVSNNYQLIASTNGIFCFEGFDVISLKNNEIDKFCINQFDTFRKNLPQEKNSIIIFGGRFPLYLNNSYFNNFEGGIENQKIKFKYLSKNNYNSLSVSFNTEVLRLSKNNKIIIVYPIPEVGWHVPPKLKNLILKDKKLLIKSNFSKEKFVTTSFEVFKERTKSSFKLLDSIQGENIYRVYPHTLFCDTTIKYRCVTHDDQNIFYADDDHPSLKGAEMINDLIMKEIKKIEHKSN